MSKVACKAASDTMLKVKQDLQSERDGPIYKADNPPPTEQHMRNITSKERASKLSRYWEIEQ